MILLMISFDNKKEYRFLLIHEFSIRLIKSTSTFNRNLRSAHNAS